MKSWQLPEHVADVLPTNARQLESARERLLALFRVHGYELVQPPLMEYSHSLLTHIDAGLSLKTILVVDQLSGRQLGIRADITPQVARIDAHLLSANQGINRLCYAGSVLHARPDGLLNMREPLQAGAEMYGLEGIEADIELIDLMLKSMKIADMGEVLLSLGHIGVFRALANAAHLDEQQSAILLSSMQDKDAEAVSQLVKEWKLDGMWAKAFSLLPRLYGGREVLTLAREKLPELSAVSAALDELQAVCDAFPNQKCISIYRNCALTITIPACFTRLMVQIFMMPWHAAAVMTDWADTSDARAPLPDSVLICAALSAAFPLSDGSPWWRSMSKTCLQLKKR